MGSFLCVPELRGETVEHAVQEGILFGGQILLSPFLPLSALVDGVLGGRLVSYVAHAPQCVEGLEGLCHTLLEVLGAQVGALTTRGVFCALVL